MGCSFRKFISVLCVLALLLAMIPTPAYAGTSGTEAACGSSAARPTAENEPCDHPAALVGGSYSPKTFGDAPDTDTAWSRLQDRIKNAADREVITLYEDITASPEDTGSLAFGDNETEKSLTLDLNGHKIDRNLDQASSSGQVIVVRAKFNLTIRDSSEEKNGSITGGKGTNLGGGIYVIYDGSLTLEGGSIEYNSATKGGGIFSEGSLTLAGGSVEHNTADYGGGVCLDRNGQFTLSGGSITGNKAVHYGGGVYTSSNNQPALMGGSITGNSADEGGGGLYSTQHVSLKSGSAITLCNNYGSSEDIPSNAFLASGKNFFVSSTPAEGTSIHVSVQQTPTRQDPVIIAFSDVNCASAFAVDNQPELTEIAWRDKKVVLKLIDDVLTWSELQQALNEGGIWDPEKQEYIIRLGADVTAGTDDNALRFSFTGGHSVIVDLCGHSINRGLGAAVENGNVLTVEKGTLILRDSVGGGTITGGNNTGSGGGVIILSDGALTLAGGRVTGNTAFDGNGGGIYVNGGRFTVSGNPAVTGNIKSSSEGLNLGSNVYLESGSVIALGGALTEGVSIGVGAAYEGRFTDSADESAFNAFSADDPYRIYLDAEQYACIESGSHHHYTASAVWADDYSSAQLTLACPCGQTEHIGIDQVAITKTENANHSFNISLTRTYEGQSYTVALENVPSFHVTVDANGGQGAADFYLPVAQGKNYAALPLTKDGIAGITPPSGAMFDALKKGGDAWHVGETVQVTEDSEFDAQWRSTWALVNEALGAGGAITLYNDITPAAGDSYLHVPRRITATLDLNGHTVDRALSAAVARGYVLCVDGTLNLNGGTITGGNNTGNGGGLYVGSGAALTTDDVNITQNQTQQDGGGIYIADGETANVTLNNTQIMYCTAMEKGGGLCLGDGGDQSSNVVGLVLLVGGIVTFCAGGTGGGIYLYKGKLKLDSGTQVLNNTDISGKNFNNIDLNEGGSASIVLPEAVSAPIAIGLPTAAAAAALPLWVKGIMVAGAVLIAAGLLTIYCDWATSKGEQGGGTCKHPSWNTEAADWDEEYYSKVDEYKSCTVCGFSKMETHTPAVTVQSETQQTEYTVVLAEGEVTRVVKPYIVLATTGISELSGITEMFPVAHGRGLGATYVLPPVPWTIEGYEFEAWAMGDETITQVVFTPIPYEDEQIVTVLANWKVSVTYDANVLLPEKYVVIGTPPQNPNPSWVFPGSPHELLPNSWEQYFVGVDDEGREIKSFYVFDGWDVSVGVKFTDKLTIEYIWETETGAPGKMPGEEAGPVMFPIMIRARWLSPWKIMDEAVNKLGGYTLPADTYATQLDTTMTVKNMLGHDGAFLDLKGYKAHAWFLSTTTNPITVQGAFLVKDSSDEKNGSISGGMNVMSGAGVIVKDDAVFELDSGNIRDNVNLISDPAVEVIPDAGGVLVNKNGSFVMKGGSVMGNSTPGSGGGVYIDSEGGFLMTGGEISSNKARYDSVKRETVKGGTGQGGGVYVGGSFRVSGKVVIKNNTVDGKANNVYLPNGKTIAVIEKLDEQAEIHVSMETPGVFTSGLKANAGDEAWGSAANFVSDDLNYEVVINADGEAELKTKAPKFDKTELELGGVLKLRFYMEYYEGWDPTGDRMAFTVNGGETRTEDYNPDTGYFVCPVNAYQMADKIEAVYYHNNEEIVRKEYTVKENLDYLKDHTSGDTLALVKATMNYGHYIQPYLAAANNWTTGRDHAIMPADGQITPYGNPAQEYGFAFTTTEKYNQYVDHTEFYLTLDAGTELNVRVYLKNGGTVTGTANGDPVNPVSRSGNSWVLSLSGIPSNALDIQYPFSCWVDNQKVFDLVISALTYANILLGRSNSSDVIEKTALTALYEYAMAAKKYRPE